jgi:hypothetical protein
MRKFTVALVNLVVFVALLGGLELYFRVTKGPFVPPAPNAMFLHTVPYVMFMNHPRTHHPAWTSIFTGETFPADVTSNNHGYNDPRDFSFTEPYRKAPNERVVLFTGGSSAWGVGSTSQKTTIAGRMEHYLNEMQSEFKYTVVNMGMGSWIAYQQFLGLELFGSAFDPDWVVVMDGHNDAGVGCATGQGVRNPLFFAVMKSYIDAYVTGTDRAVFYRGWLENELIKYSAAYRALSGKDYIRNPQVFDETNIDRTRDEARKVIIPTKLGESREMLAFYLKAQEATLRLFPKAKYVLSTQPMVNQFTGDFTDVYANMDPEIHRAAMLKRAREVEHNLEVNQDKWCNTQTFPPSFIYLYINGAIQLEFLAERARAKGQFVEYHNMGRLLPDDRNARMPYFIDAAHITDKGADVLGRFYAERIHAADSATKVQEGKN